MCVWSPAPNDSYPVTIEWLGGGGPEMYSELNRIQRISKTSDDNLGTQASL